MKDNREGREEFRGLIVAAVMLCLVMVFGTLGYMLVEGWSLLDALYMTVITVTTAGYREVHPLSDEGKVFTMLLLLSGVGALLYTAVSAIEFVVDGRLGGWMEKRRTEKAIGGLRKHYILCGYGRVGREIAKEYRKARKPLVVIEDNAENYRRCLNDGFFCVNGDATRDEVLVDAGIEEAKGVFTALSSDQKNVLVTLTARTLNPKAFIVGRGEDEESHRKLKHAGADRVISPYTIGGRRMASLMIKPFVSDYLDVVMHGDQLELQLDEISVSVVSQLVGKTIRDAQIRDRTGSLILAIHKKGDSINTNPSPEHVIGAGDVLLVIGTAEQLEQLGKMV